MSARGSRFSIQRTPRLADVGTHNPVLVLAPVGRDAETIGRVLADIDVQSVPCQTMGDLCSHLGEETLLLVLAEEGLAAGAEALLSYLDGQADWSDLPIIILAAAGPRRGSEARWRLFEQ